MAQCKSCGAEIEWIKTEAGKNHPIDAKPKQMWIQYGLEPFRLFPCHESHFATCPNADQHRSKK